MKYIVCLALLVGAFALPVRAADNELTAAEKKEGWILLFDGKTLAGWDGDPTVWRVENGYISGKAEKVSHNTFCIYKEPAANFHFQCDVMLIKGKGFTNSGIQYRSKVANAKEWIVRGYQADIGAGWWGALYEEGGRGVLWKPTPEATKTVKADDWNHCEIIADGAKIKQLLNGVLSGELDDKNEAKRSLAGVIALQYHTPGQNFEVRFKNLKLKKLP